MPEEEVRVGCLVMGQRTPPHFTAPRPELFDEWDAKYLGELVTRAAYPGEVAELRPARNGERRLWDIVVGDDTRGTVCAVDVRAAVSAAAAPAYGVELSLGPMDASQVAPGGKNAHGRASQSWHAPVVPRYRPLPTTPAAPIDLALVVPDGRTAADVEAVIRRVAGDLLESLELFDVYSGPGIASGHRSLAWRLTLRHPERTLSSKEVDARRAQILRALEAELGIGQR
jgi:phenylalanyl-tRNA synthetase beta chain